MHHLTLKPGKEKSLLRHHPWIFSGATSLPANLQPGETLLIRSAGGQALAAAAVSPTSQIVARVWSFNPQEPIDRSFFQKRITQSIACRDAAVSATRLIYSESDGLPGFIVDRYRDRLVLQALSAGAEAWKATVADILMEIPGIKGIYERSDASVRKKEGLAPCTGPLQGEPPPALIEIEENGVRILVDVAKGHKTGFYLDQRENRALVGTMASGADVLNCFCYTGGFGLHALKGGAKQVTQIDESADALGLARRNATVNGFDDSHHTLVRADVFQQLREYARAKRQFDLVILDPPKFIESKMQIMKGARGYKDINRIAFELVRPGGHLVTFSCSGLLETDLFQKIVADAALDAHREAVITRRLSQGPDHPIHLAFPEAAYLKGLVCRVQ